MPSILVELGFLTNKNEGKYLNSKKGQQQMANTIAKAIKKYVNQLRLNTISPDKDTISNQNQETKEEEKTIKPIKKNTLYSKFK